MELLQWHLIRIKISKISENFCYIRFYLLDTTHPSFLKLFFQALKYSKKLKNEETIKFKKK